jgi:putative MATE family efflux protein
MRGQNSIQLLTEGSVRQRLLKYAAPIFIGNLFQQLYNTADSLIVGNFVGQSALAAVSSVSSLLNLFIGFFMGFSAGATVIIAHAIGADDREKTVKAVHTAFALGLILSVILTVLGVYLSPWMLTVMGTPEDVYPLAVLYTRIYFGGSAALVMYNMLVGILQAGGDSRHPLYYLIASSCVNIVFDLLLVSVFHMGVAGAAIATVCSEALSMVLCLIRLLKDDSAIGLHLKQTALTPPLLKQILRFGIPTGLQSSIIDISNVMIQSYINSFGTAAAAGIGAYTKVEGFMFLPVTAFSIALTTFISQNEGAGRKDRVRESVRFGINTCVLMVETIGLIIFLFAPSLVRMFNSDPEVIHYGVMRARTCAFFYALLAFSHIVSAICRGEQEPVMPMAVMLICWCAVRVIILMTVGQVVHDIRLANWLYPFTWSISTVVFSIWLKKRNLYSFRKENA